MFFLFFRYWFAVFPLLFHFVFSFLFAFFHFCFRFFPRVVYMFEGLGHQVTWERKSTTKQAEKTAVKKTAKEDRKKKNEKKPTAYKCISGLPLFAFFAFIKIVICFFSLCFCFFQKVVCFFCIGFRFFVFKFLRSRLQAFHNNSVSCCYWNKHCFPEASDFMGLL